MNVVLQLFRVPETRKRLLSTMLLLVIYRLGFHVPIPGLDPNFLQDLSSTGSNAFGLLSAFTGGALGNTVLFALGIMPYISASIIFSVLGKVSPAIENLQKEGASGQKKINQWTRMCVVPISFIQAILIWFGFFQDAQITQSRGIGMMTVVILSLMGGAFLVMWIGELITEYGIGNGASLIIMAGIISTMPGSLSQILQQQDDAYNTILTLVAIWITVVLFIVFIQKAERRIPIQYARLARGRRVYGGQRHYLPLKINMAGVMPIIFAGALFVIPSVVFNAVGLDGLAAVFSDTDGFVYITLYLALVFGFCFFWNNLMFRPDEIADNLREHGSFVPGIRPGQQTAKYLKGILTRITLAGAIFLALIAVLPNFITGNIPGLQGQLAFFLGGTSVLIVVGVALDVVDRLNAELVMRNYDGFMKGKPTGGSGLGGAGGTGAGGQSAGWAKRS
ncbi:MAG: preprotein translocase subunit SecY [Planctomycetota bacterium]